jgi:hypothetical protein
LRNNIKLSIWERNSSNQRQLESEIARLKDIRSLYQNARENSTNTTRIVSAVTKNNSQLKILNEREASRTFFKRKSIISSHEVNKEEKTLTVYHIKNLKQLRNWMKEYLKIISFMIQKFRKNNDIMISEYNMMIEKHDYLFDFYQALLNKIVN